MPALAAFFLLGWTALPLPAAAAAENSLLSIESVEPGREGLELTALLSENGGAIQRNISWTIRAADGATVFSGDTPTADVSVPPGEYVVDARYGAAIRTSSISLPKASRLMVSFVMNAGGLKVQPRVDGSGATAQSRVRVFVVGGENDGRLVITAAMPGDILRLPEGRYRVESRTAFGNASAVTDVKVKPGRMSWIDITFKAGLARLAFVGSPSARVRWNVEDDKGHAVASRHGLTAEMVLQPGTYTAKAEVSGELLTATFSIAAGDTRDILLGN